MSIKYSNAPDTTVTYNRNELDEPTANIYKTVSILAKRSIQINEELRTELFEKLEEFATPIETLEEISIQGKESFLESGGEKFDTIPCLNDNEDHIKLLVHLINKSIRK